MSITDTHSVYAALDNGTIVRIGNKGRDWHSAIAYFTMLDDARIEGRMPGVKYLAVRADDDQDARWKNAKRLTGCYLPGHVFPRLEAAGRAVAKEQGLTGREGGWLYTASGQPYTQGYASLVASANNRHSINGVAVDGNKWITAYNRDARGYVLKVALGIKAYMAAHTPVGA